MDRRSGQGKVTRLLLIFLALTASTVSADELADRVAAVPNPRAQDGGWVADPAGVIASRKADINGLITALEQKTGTEIAVVVLPTIGNAAPKDFAVRLIEKWGVGKKGRDNGVLVLHVLDQRRIEIETGYGMEGILPDVKCRWITEQIAVPFFRKNSFADGHYEVVRALIRGIEKPAIKQAELVSQWEVQPGVNVNPDPSKAANMRPRNYDESNAGRTKERNALGLVAALAVFFAGLAIYLLVARKLRKRSEGKSLHEQYQLYKNGLALTQYASAVSTAAAASLAELSLNRTFFSSAPILIAAVGGLMLHRKSRLRALREAPRTCHCGRTMHRASESEDDAFIQAGNVAEELIQSMDYDVWLCEEGHSSTEAYSGKVVAERCQKCNFITFRQTESRVLKQATYSSTGLRETTFTCANCRHTVRDTSIIPQLTTSSSSGGRSSGSSGSSGGSSFGGGRSGGGGAGSSY